MDALKKAIKVIAIILLVLFSGLEVCGIIRYADDFINGYINTDFVGVASGERVYGLDAIRQDGWGHIFYVPVIHIASLLQCICLWAGLKGTEQKKTAWLITIVLLVFNISIWLLLL